MATTGIKLEKNSKGNLIRAIIDLRKRPDFLKHLEQVGAIEKDEFDTLFENGITGDELRKRVCDHIDELFDKKESK